MSLTTFVAVQHIRERIREEFAKPRLEDKPQMLAPPVTKNYALVGIAFDYLLRFHLQYRNPKAHARNWIAEHGMVFLKTKKELFEQACGLMEQARLDYSLFLQTGKQTDSLVRSVVFLAKMDSLYRIGPFHPVFLPGQEGKSFRSKFLTPDERDEADLQKLIAVLPKGIFNSKRVCILNPTFGNASALVGGGDADLVLDDMLIEVKTTKNFELSRYCFNQLIGYYCLYKIGGIDGARRNCRIRKIGVYFSRHAYLWSVTTKELAEDEKFERFARWFKRAAKQSEQWEVSPRVSARKKKSFAGFIKASTKGRKQQLN